LADGIGEERCVVALAIDIGQLRPRGLRATDVGAERPIHVSLGVSHGVSSAGDG
jgi:hypothetical protein